MKTLFKPPQKELNTETKRKESKANFPLDTNLLPTIEEANKKEKC